MGQITNGQRGKCTAQKNILVFGHESRAAYALRLGPSGLSPWKRAKGLLKAVRGAAHLPMSTHLLKVTTKYEESPAPHFVPVFEVVGQVPFDFWIETIKPIKKDSGLLIRTVEVATDQPDDEHAPPTADQGNELPPGVEPVGKVSQDDDSLPF